MVLGGTRSEISDTGKVMCTDDPIAAIITEDNSCAKLCDVACPSHIQHYNNYR
jgi:hypothetical protein